MDVTQFPPVAEARGRLLARTDPEKAAMTLNGLVAQGVYRLTSQELSQAAGIVAGLRSKGRCQGCGYALPDAFRERGICTICWEDDFRPIAWPQELDLAVPAECEHEAAGTWSETCIACLNRDELGL